jgi:hypothetical protein
MESNTDFSDVRVGDYAKPFRSVAHQGNSTDGDRPESMPAAWLCAGAPSSWVRQRTDLRGKSAYKRGTPPILKATPRNRTITFQGKHHAGIKLQCHCR